MASIPMQAGRSIAPRGKQREEFFDVINFYINLLILQVTFFTHSALTQIYIL